MQASDEHPSAVFLRGEGDEIIPTECAQGPWDPNAWHGGAICGLLARALESQPMPGPMRFARMTFDMMRSVPIAPLRWRARTLRGGRRILVVEAELFDGDKTLARATGLAIRTATDLGLEGAPNLAADEPLPLRPGEGQKPTMRMSHMPGYIRAVDFVRADGEPTGDQPSTVWLRFRRAFVEGETTSRLVQLAGLADFGSGAGNALDFSRYVSINPDLSVHVLRYPASDWLAIRGETRIAREGIGQSLATVYDERGEVARVQSSLLVDARPEGAPMPRLPRAGVPSAGQ